MPDFIEIPTDEPRKVHYTHSTIPDIDAVCAFDLKISQERRLTCDRNGSFAIVLKNIIPSEA